MSGQGGDRLVILGSKGGPAIRPGGPSPTSTLLELGGRRIVVDCGLGVSRGLVEAGAPLPSVSTVFITHLHSDHVLELGPLIHTAWTSGLRHPITVYGPVGTDSLWHGFLNSLAYDIAIRIEDEGRPSLEALVQVIEYGEGLVIEEDGLRVEALRVQHPPITECFALKFSFNGHVIGFSADTTYFPPLSDFMRHVNILVHEAMHPDGVERLVARTGNGERLREHLLASHTLAADAGRIATMAEVDLLVLHHLVPADDPDIGPDHWRAAIADTWVGPLIVARDGLAIDLSNLAAEILAARQPGGNQP